MLAQITVALVALLSSIIIYRNIKVFNFWRSRGIKGPSPWPLIGTNHHYFIRTKVEVDDEWRQKYGRVYGIYEGLTPVLRVSDARLVKEIWIKQFSSITDRNHHFVFQDNITRWLFFSRGQHWSNQRVLISPIFSTTRLRKIFNALGSCTGKFLSEIDSRLKSRDGNSDQKKQVLFSKDEVMSLNLDIIGRAFFGLKLDTYKDKASEFYRKAFAFAKFDVPWFIIWMMIPGFISKYFKLDLVLPSKYEYFDKLGQKIIDERRQARTSDSQYDFMQALLDASIPTPEERVFTADDDRDAHYNDQMDHKQMQQELIDQTKGVAMKKLTDLEIKAQMTFFFLAGFETTSSSLTFCFYTLAHEPEIQERLYEELKSIAHSSASSDNPDLEYSELVSLRELDAFVSEILRLYSPVTENNRMVTSDQGVTLSTEPPLHLPKGSIIAYSGFVLHRDPEYWPDPLKFDPSRFYPENKDRIVSGSYAPFGLGPRNCAGMRFAILSIKSTLAKILLKYKITPGPKSMKFPPEFNQHNFFLQLKHDDFILTPRLGA